MGKFWKLNFVGSHKKLLPHWKNETGHKAFAFKNQGLGSIKVNSAEFENKRKTQTNSNLKVPWAPFGFGLSFSYARMSLSTVVSLPKPFFIHYPLFPYLSQRRILFARLSPRAVSNLNAALLCFACLSLLSLETGSRFVFVKLEGLSATKPWHFNLCLEAFPFFMKEFEHEQIILGPTWT